MIWGVWGYDFEIVDMQVFIKYCLELGIIIFDYVDIYGYYMIEEVFGKVWGGLLILCFDVQLVSKCGI